MESLDIENIDWSSEVRQQCLIPPACPFKVRTQAPVWTFHIFKSPSRDPEIKIWSSDEREQQETIFACPRKVRTQIPVWTFQIVKFLSLG